MASVKTIHKFEVIADFNYPRTAVVNLPQGAQIVDINYQPDHYGKNSLFLWAIVDVPSPIIEAVVLAIYATGASIQNAERLTHIKTVHDPLGHVWHIFKAK